MSMSMYYHYVFRSHAEVEAFSGVRWEHLPNPPEYDHLLAEDGGGSWVMKFPAYEYIAYLRHHGFPSPLLDWTRSPFVATYFAFESIPEGAKNVAIYCYMEYGSAGKSGSGNEPTILFRE
jgi:hypothetical protein